MCSHSSVGYLCGHMLKRMFSVKESFSLHHAVIYEPIFELHQPQQSMEKAYTDTESKYRVTTACSLYNNPLAATGQSVRLAMIS